MRKSKWNLAHSDRWETRNKGTENKDVGVQQEANWSTLNENCVPEIILLEPHSKFKKKKFF